MVVHTRAHHTTAQVQAMDDQGREGTKGNSRADHWAKQGADLGLGAGREATLQDLVAKLNGAIEMVRAAVGSNWTNSSSLMKSSKSVRIDWWLPTDMSPRTFTVIPTRS